QPLQRDTQLKQVFDGEAIKKVIELGPLAYALGSVTGFSQCAVNAAPACGSAPSFSGNVIRCGPGDNLIGNKLLNVAIPSLADGRSLPQSACKLVKWGTAGTVQGGQQNVLCIVGLFFRELSAPLDLCIARDGFDQVPFSLRGGIFVQNLIFCRVVETNGV